MEAERNVVRTIRLKNRTLLVLVILLLAMQIISPDRVWLVLLLGLAGALLLSYFWARALRRGLWMRRNKRFSWAKVGEPLQERFELGNDARFPALWVTVLDESNFPGYKADIARFIERFAVRRWIKGSMFQKRGYYTWGPTELRAGDPFGIFDVRITYPELQKMLVVPPVIPLPFIEIATGNQAGEGGLKMYAPERTVTAASVRDYAVGDDLHAIHWLTSARRDDLYVRIFDQTPISNWWIFLDMEESVQVGEGLDATEEYGIILAASIAERGLRNSRAVGLIAEGKKQLQLLPQSNNAQRWEILHGLATVERGERPLVSLLAGAQRILGRNESAVIITPTLDEAWLQTAAMLMRRNVALTVLWLDPSAFGAEVEVPSSILQQLVGWGINHYRITPDVFDAPEGQDHFIGRRTPYGRQSATFDSGVVDWGKFK